MKRLIAFSCLCPGLSTILFAQAGGEVTGNSPRMAGLAGSGLAGGVDLTEASHNPAMLGFVLNSERSGQFEFSLRGISNPVIGSDIGGGRFNSSDFNGLGPWLGIGFALPGNFAAGLNVVPTAGGSLQMSRLTELNIAADESVPGSGVFDLPREHWVEIQNEILQLSVDPSLSWSPAPGVSFGLGASFRSTTMNLASATEFDLGKLQGAPPPPLNGIGATWGEFLQELGTLSGRELSHFQVDYSAEAEADMLSYLRLGFAWESDYGTRVGFWYRPPSTKTDLSGTVDIDLDADLGDLIREVFDEDTPTTSSYDLDITDVRFPQQLGLACMTPASRFDRLHFQAVWTQWSDTFDGWTANLTNGDNDQFSDMLGGDGSTEFDLDNEWNDSFFLSCGWEHDWTWAPAPWARRQIAANGKVTAGWDVTSRLGLGWASNPVSGSMVPGLMPFNQWHVGGGVSLRSAPFGGHWNLGFVVALPESIKVGENDVLSDLSYDTYRQSNYALMVGYSRSW
jgi:hypothetical protein